jgi:hypothetical protein
MMAACRPRYCLCSIDSRSVLGCDRHTAPTGRIDRIPESPHGFNGVLAVPAVTTTKVTMSNQLGPSTPYSDTLAVRFTSGVGRSDLGHAG